MITFLHVVEAGTLTEAARRLRLSKSVVSKRIRDLEEALEQSLLHRSTRRVVPTEKGRALYDRVRPLVRELDSAVSEVTDPEGSVLRGRLRVTAPMTFGTMHLTSMLARFAREHPRLELALELDDRVLDLAAGDYDLAIRIGWLESSSLVARKLCMSRRVMCCSPRYAEERGLPRSIEDLAAHDCIDYANVHATRLWQFAPRRRGGRPRSVATRSRIVANNGEAMRDAAIEGLGLALLPTFIAADALRRGLLIDALPGESPLPYTIAALYPPTRHVAPKVRVLVDYLVRELGSTPPWEQDLLPSRG
jgi:DNA-binding transcriptional LysR family regulator